MQYPVEPIWLGSDSRSDGGRPCPQPNGRFTDSVQSAISNLAFAYEGAYRARDGLSLAQQAAYGLFGAAHRKAEHCGAAGRAVACVPCRAERTAAGRSVARLQLDEPNAGEAQVDRRRSPSTAA